MKRYDRFTRATRLGRGNIPKKLRHDVYKRDRWTCVFCGLVFPADELTIDHLIPLALGGTDDVTNYATSCRSCNQRKAAMSLTEFASMLSIPLDTLPVHGDPVIDNMTLPEPIRLLRKQIFVRSRSGELALTGKSAQKKLEKEFRRAFWATPEGKQLENDFVSLPGHARVMLPEIRGIASSKREFILLVELSKSANTRNLIGSVIEPGSDVEELVRRTERRTQDHALRKRLRQALTRFERIVGQTEPPA